MKQKIVFNYIHFTLEPSPPPPPPQKIENRCLRNKILITLLRLLSFLRWLLLWFACLLDSHRPRIIRGKVTCKLSCIGQESSVLCIKNTSFLKFSFLHRSCAQIKANTISKRNYPKFNQQYFTFFSMTFSLLT